ncbi:MAG: GNAT family N-acetyltransferase [Pelagimonas sp.]|jgi:RimJ/RimL family protein N-acetyltransferase|nr:GNAT family N-acetyltransferase [Pelagimonas sp.]
MTAPVLQTERLTLRGPEIGDFDALCAYFQDPRSAFNGGPRTPVEVWTTLTSSVGHWHLRGYGLWFITGRDDGRFMGFAGIIHPMDWPEAELGYGITAQAEGKGIAFEAVQAARQGAATHFGLTHLPSYPSPQNLRSLALVKRLGATYEGDITLRETVAQVWRHPEVAP